MWRCAGVLAALVALATAAPGQAPAVDRTKPEAVAQAYLDALRRVDVAAVRELSARDKNMDMFLTLFIGQVSKGPEGQMLSEGGLAELALFPMPKSSPLVLGARAADADDKVTYELTRQVQLKPRLVLTRQADGVWAVDLAASLKATAQDGKSAVLAIAEMMDALPEGAIPDDEAAQPWQCMNHLRELGQTLRAFADEHQGKLPPAATWYDELLPYLDDPKAVSCPDHADEEFGYAFNAELGGTGLPDDWEQLRRLPMLACVHGDEANMTFAPTKLEALAGRHGKMLVYATATGEAMVLPEDWTFERVRRDQEQTEGCRARARALAQAVKDYAKTHDGKLPPADNWVEALRPLVAKPRDGGSPFICPAAANAALVSYAYLPAVAGKRLSSLVNHRKVAIFREIEGAEGSPMADEKDVAPARHHCEWSQVRRVGFWHEIMLDGSVQSRSVAPATAGGGAPPPVQVGGD